MYQTALVWLRRDLRFDDNPAFEHAAQQAKEIIPVFVFDKDILGPLPKEDRRVQFIWNTLCQLKETCQESDLLIRYGFAKIEIPQLVKHWKVDAVFCNHDDEPASRQRDDEISLILKQMGVHFHTFKDHVIFERDEILTASRKPFSVFTPYKKAWLSELKQKEGQLYPKSLNVERRLKPMSKEPMIPLESMGFKPVKIFIGPPQVLFDDFQKRIDSYHETRDFPGIKGVSYLSTHLRFGTLSIRKLVLWALKKNTPGSIAWLSELIWRDFYHQILWHHPSVVYEPFLPQYRGLSFPNDPFLFEVWCKGETGYPLVDAGMRQLNQTGYMHNRLRMVTASFLVKDLLIDYRWGERYFAEKLMDFDLASNNGGWQWCAGTGCDAQPYFRIFNPITQSKKFDPEGRFILRYIKELEGFDVHEPWRSHGCRGVYPSPVVDHALQRKKALAFFQRRV